MLAATVRHNRGTTTLLSVAGIAAAVVASVAGLRGLSGRFAELMAQHGDPSRLATWRDTLHVVPDFAWTGSRLGTFAFVFRRSEPYLPLKTIDHAHSDYLELLVELGMPGTAFLFGSVAFVFLHATADFPLQIPAVAAMAAVLLGLACGLVSPSPSPGGWARGVSGFVCAGLCLVSLLLLQGRWSALDAEALSRNAHSAAMQGGVDEAEFGYVAALTVNPFAAAAWVARAELAETYGDEERALDMLKLARRLEPLALRTEWALANAYLRRGNHNEAARHFELLAASIPEMRVRILDAAWRGGILAADVATKIVPDEGEAAGEFLNYLVREREWADLAPTYAAFDEGVRRSIPVDLMRYTFDQAFAAGETDVHLDLWQKTTGAVDNPGGPLAIEHDGPPESFGLDGYGLQWTIRPHRGVTTQAVTSKGRPASIEVTFAEPQNLHYSHVARDFTVHPSRHYVLHAEVQADEITSSQGVRLLVAAPRGSIVESRPIRGTKDWSKVRLAFQSGPKERVLRLTVVRYPSTTFDRDITGRFRLRNVRVAPR